MRRTFVLLAAAAVAAGAAAQSHATQEIPPPVQVETTGACESGYREVVRAGSIVVCVVNLRPPAVRPTTTGCGAGETAYTVDGRYGVCVS